MAFRALTLWSLLSSQPPFTPVAIKPILLPLPSISSIPFPNLLSDPCFLVGGKHSTPNRATHPELSIFRLRSQSSDHVSFILSKDRYHIFHILVPYFPKQNHNRWSNNMDTYKTDRQISRHTISPHRTYIVYEFCALLIQQGITECLLCHIAGTQ